MARPVTSAKPPANDNEWSLGLHDLRPDLADAVFMPIDLQAAFCCPSKGLGNTATVAVTHKILDIAPQFNALGLKSCWVYYSWPTGGVENAYGGPFEHNFIEDDMNIITEKPYDDGFRNPYTPLAETAHDLRLTTLFMAGVSQNACVERTAIGAMCRGYDVVVIEDLCANNKIFKGTTQDILDNARALQRGDRRARDATAHYKVAPHLKARGKDQTGRLFTATSGALLASLAARPQAESRKAAKR